MGAHEHRLVTDEDVSPSELSLRERARSVARTSRLHAMTAALSTAVTPGDVARTVVERLLQLPGAIEGGLWVAGEGAGDDATALLFGAAVDSAAGTLLERHPLSDERMAPIAEAIRTGEPVFGVPPDGDDDAALACLPLEAEGRCFGAVGVLFHGPRAFDYDERVSLVVVARLAAQALVRAQLREGERVARAEADAARQFAVDSARLWDEARRAIRSRDDVLAVVSHDLKNPLESVLLSAAMLLRSPESPRVRRYAEALQRAASRMDRLIRDLLDLSGMDAGRFRVELRPERLEPIVEDALAVLAPLAAERGIAVSIERATPGVEARCDRERIFQVLSNLVGNALHFTERGGRVTVRIAERAGEAELSVIDDGRGIPPEDLPHVFDRYWKSRSRLGTGLGLAIARGIAEAHGGRISAESTIGAGTTFTFTLAR